VSDKITGNAFNDIKISCLLRFFEQVGRFQLKVLFFAIAIVVARLPAGR
jgi:hypothetical protein